MERHPINRGAKLICSDRDSGRLDVAGVDFVSTLIVKTVIVASQLPRASVLGLEPTALGLEHPSSPPSTRAHDRSK